MKLHPSILGVGLLLTLTMAVHAQAGTDTLKKLIGVWEMSKAEKLLPGATVEFTSDSKILLRAKIADRELKVDGTFAVKDNVITSVTKENGKERTAKMKIKTLTDKVLVVENEQGQSEEYKKK